MKPKSRVLAPPEIKVSSLFFYLETEPKIFFINIQRNEK